MAQRRVSSQQVKQFPTVRVRHGQVNDDQGWLHAFQYAQALIPICGLIDLSAILGQHIVDQCEAVRFVVYDEYFPVGWFTHDFSTMGIEATIKGNWTLKTLPLPTSLSTRTVPSISWASLRTIARPRPV